MRNRPSVAGLPVHAFGAALEKVLFSRIVPGSRKGILGLFFTTLGIVVMGVGVYRGAIAGTKRTTELADKAAPTGHILVLLGVPMAYALVGSIPGALVGLVSGFSGFHRIVAAVVGAFLFVTCPYCGKRWGQKAEKLTWFFAVCIGVGAGLASLGVGEVLHDF